MKANKLNIFYVIQWHARDKKDVAGNEVCPGLAGAHQVVDN